MIEMLARHSLGFWVFFSLVPSKDEPALQGYFAEQMTRDFNKWKPKEMLFGFGFFGV